MFPHEYRTMEISFKLKAFEGPLELLLHLIEKNKIDIYDIPIVELTDQYLAYLDTMQTEDLGIMSEFLVMAATLLDIKCRMLLPKPKEEDGEEEDPRSELVQKLLEYKMYKYMSYELRDRMEEADAVYFRGADLPKEVLSYREPVTPEELLEGLTLEKLNRVFRSLMKRQNDRVDPVRSRFGKIEKEPVSVSQKLLFLKEYAARNRRFSFRDLVAQDHSRVSIVVSFLSLLELIRMGHIGIRQEELFDDIMIEVLDDPAQWKNLMEEYGEEETDAEQ